jgi:hypothetical protein
MANGVVVQVPYLGPRIQELLEVQVVDAAVVAPAAGQQVLEF